MAETTYGSKEQLQVPASEATQDGRSHDKRMHELEKVGSGLVQAESNVGSQAASSQDFVHQHSHEMPSYSSAIGQGAYQGYRRGQPNEPSAGGDSIDYDKKVAQETAAHHRHRSSISMAGPHICPQLEASRDLDSSHAYTNERAAAHESFDARDTLAMARNSSKRQDVRLESEPSMNALSQSYGAVQETNQSSQNILGQSYQQNAQLDLSMNYRHQNYALSKSFADGQQQWQPSLAAPPTSQSYNFREHYGRPLRSKSLRPQAQIESPGTN